ncbi:MAG TPA: hypothetical protein VFD19_04710 [Clostridia bacterium]|nr:hypothetical protein [Clostridia bacterium]
MDIILTENAFKLFFGGAQALPALTVMMSAGVLLFVIAILAVTITGVVKNRKSSTEARRLADDAVESLSTSKKEHMLPADAIVHAFSNSDEDRFKQFADLLSKSAHMYCEGRLLPEPAPILASLGLFQTTRVKARSKLFAWTCFAIGGFGTVLLVSLRTLLNISFDLWLIMLPLLVFGIACSLFLLWHENKTVHFVDDEQNRLIAGLSLFAPVLRERLGVAVLVSEIISYGEKMRHEVEVFSRLAEELTAGEFAEGINTSVRRIMSEEIAPPLQEANHALTELAISLAQKQEQGMGELSDFFSESVARSLAVHLAPLPDKLQILHLVAEHSADMMEEAKIAMEQSRAENKEISLDTHEALRLMALAKNDLADEMASISESLELIGASTDKMTALYSGEQTNLAFHINRMAEQLRIYSEKLDLGIVESSKAIEASVKISASQNKNALLLLDRLNEQLGALEDVSRQISENTTHFTKESSSYVVKTLDEFEANLAEVVERLTFTTAEIRDAVDALPPAIRRTGRES